MERNHFSTTKSLSCFSNLVQAICYQGSPTSLMATIWTKHYWLELAINYIWNDLTFENRQMSWSARQFSPGIISVQYRGRGGEGRGGGTQYPCRCAVPWWDILSTVRQYLDYCGWYSVPWGYHDKCGILSIPHICIMIPPTVLNLSHSTLRSSPTVLRIIPHGTEHPHGTQANHRGTQDIPNILYRVTFDQWIARSKYLLQR